MPDDADSRRANSRWNCPSKCDADCAEVGAFALRHTGDVRCQSQQKRYLDVGCGNGLITELFDTRFDEVVGIDLERNRLEDFRAHVRTKPNYTVVEMSATKIEFANEFFSFITCFEVLEHVSDIEAVLLEIVRVCKKGGVVVISAPQAWFPFENHGFRLGNRTYEEKFPCCPTYAHYTEGILLQECFPQTRWTRCFSRSDLNLLATSYASPQFERAAADPNSWEAKFSFLRSIFDRCESIPILRNLTGVSMLKAYRKPLS